MINPTNRFLFNFKTVTSMALLTHYSASELKDKIDELQNRNEELKKRLETYIKANVPDYNVNLYQQRICQIEMAIHSIDIILMLNSIIDS